MTDAPLLKVLRADVEATTHPNYRLYSDRAFWTRALGKLLLGPNVRAVITYRIAHLLHRRGWTPIAMYLRARALRQSGAEIHPAARIGAGLYLVHSSGIVIGPNSVVGRNCTLHQGVTLGPPRPAVTDVDEADTVLGDGVVLGAHVVVMSGVRIGDGAVVGANAVVTRDVPAGTVVAGVPARTIGTV